MVYCCLNIYICYNNNNNNNKNWNVNENSDNSILRK